MSFRGGATRRVTSAILIESEMKPDSDKEPARDAKQDHRPNRRGSHHGCHSSNGRHHGQRHQDRDSSGTGANRGITGSGRFTQSASQVGPRVHGHCSLSSGHPIASQQSVIAKGRVSLP